MDPWRAFQINRSDAETLDILSLLAQTVCSSKGEARRLVQGGGIYIDNERVVEPTTPVSSTKLVEKGFLVLRSGKKNYHIVKLAE